MRTVLVVFILGGGGTLYLNNFRIQGLWAVEASLSLSENRWRRLGKIGERVERWIRAVGGCITRKGRGQCGAGESLGGCTYRLQTTEERPSLLKAGNDEWRQNTEG